MLEWVKYPNDTDATRTNYTYDSMYRTASAAVNTNTGDSLSADYTYENDLLTEIETASTIYSFTYGDFALRTAVAQGTVLCVDTGLSFCYNHSTGDVAQGTVLCVDTGLSFCYNQTGDVRCQDRHERKAKAKYIMLC